MMNGPNQPRVLEHEDSAITFDSEDEADEFARNHTWCKHFGYEIFGWEEYVGIRSLR